jgi:hypothetical protein
MVCRGGLAGGIVEVGGTGRKRGLSGGRVLAAEHAALAGGVRTAALARWRIVRPRRGLPYLGRHM